MEGSIEALMTRVRQRMREEELAVRAAAAEVGVTVDSLSRHLSGAYVRSDSAAKYRIWLDGLEADPPRVDRQPESRIRSPLENLQLGPIATQTARWRVVDLFSGCGGLSLGFDLVEDGRVFETVLAVDVEDAMVHTFNVNHCRSRSPVARKVDLSDFINEAEVRAFYLDHLRMVEEQPDIDALLARGKPISLDTFKAVIARLDRDFLDAFESIRSIEPFSLAYADLDSRALGQTSVRGFHESLRLPVPSTRSVDLGSMLWREDGAVPTQELRLPRAFENRWSRQQREIRGKLTARWDREAQGLRKQAEGSGRGQLASSARRIGQFLEFLEAVPSLRQIWLDWRTQRDSLRFLLFREKAVDESMLEAYTGDRRVALLLGGPPCQGFSRIGRGKIRSLRDDRVHVHYDAEAGDVRNRLFEKYVLFVSALQPPVFVFENVKHFQTEVQTPDGTFLATEILAEAVRELSDGGLNYRLASKTIMASDHMVPQRRDRFFMAGVLEAVAALEAAADVSEWLLTLPVQEEVPLRHALHDLPPAFEVGGQGVGAGLDRAVDLGSAGTFGGGSNPAARYARWITQAAGHGKGSVDSHVARDHRRDDREWFGLMGPGNRWMDYRCDSSPTLNMISRAIHALMSAGAADGKILGEYITSEELNELASRVDGDLSIRLLLESIDPLPGELGHHLLKDTYLRKREGNHGDWLARLDGSRACKTIVTHMGKDTYAYVHPWEDRSLSVREAARVQSFPDSFSFGHLGLVDAFRVIGNAVPPLLSYQMADRVAQLLTLQARRQDEHLQAVAV
ncbi:MAG: DNA cytosine methyltransferase [Gemmatimonadota bacterium]